MSREQNETMERVTDAMDEQIAPLRRERDQAEQGRREALAEAQRAWDAATAMRAECETMASERNAAWREASDLRVALDKVRAQRDAAQSGGDQAAQLRQERDALRVAVERAEDRAFAISRCAQSVAVANEARDLGLAMRGALTKLGGGR